jgi:hypothetical protein
MISMGPDYTWSNKSSKGECIAALMKPINLYAGCLKSFQLAGALEQMSRLCKGCLIYAIL